MKKLLAASFLLAAGFFLTPAGAEDSSPANRAVIAAPESIEVGRMAIFDGGDSRVGGERPSRFFWEFGDDETSLAAEVGHRFEKPGRYRIQLTVAEGEERISTTREIVVFRERLFLLADPTADAEILSSFRQELGMRDVFLAGALAGEGGESKLLSLLKEKRALVDSTSLLVVWAEEEKGLAALTSFAQEAGISFAGKTILAVTSGSPAALAPFGRIAFRVLQPEEILLATPDALFTALLSGRENLAERLADAGKDFLSLDTKKAAAGRWDLFGAGVTELLAAGVSREAVTLLLLFPAALFLAAAWRILGGFPLPGGVFAGAAGILLFWQIGNGALALLLLAAAGFFLARLRESSSLPAARRAAEGTALLLLLLAAAGFFPALGKTFFAAGAGGLLLLFLLADRLARPVAETFGKGISADFASILFLAIGGAALLSSLSAESFFLARPAALLLFLPAAFLLARWRRFSLAEIFLARRWQGES
jgi:hypothetical protein